MNNMKTGPMEMKDRTVTDSNGRDIGRVREVEQEVRTGRYSTIHIEVDARNAQKAGMSGWHHLPLSTDHVVMDRDSIRACRTIESLNSQFTDKISVKKSKHSQHELIDKPVYDRNRTQVGIAKDVRASSDNGEFGTILVELDRDIREKMSLENIAHVRIKLDRVEEVGKEIRLDRQVEELGREWNEIILHR